MTVRERLEKLESSELFDLIEASRGHRPLRDLAREVLAERDRRDNVLARSRARSAGTVVEQLGEEATRRLESDATVGRYSLLCVPHSGFVCVETRKQARQWAAAPEDWCPGCQGEAD